MKARRVASLADVHGNAPALAAVQREVKSENVDLLVHAGDLIWGPLVEETLELVRGYDSRAAFVRGNADRVVLELANGTRHDPTDREHWMSAHHDTHGSPRGDTECVTVATPETRVREFMPDRTDYDLSETIAAYRQTNDPTLEQMVEMLEQPRRRTS